MTPSRLVLPLRVGKWDTSSQFVLIVRSSQRGGNRGAGESTDPPSAGRRGGIGTGRSAERRGSARRRRRRAPTGYVTMSDGVEIAVNVRLPDGLRARPAVPDALRDVGLRRRFRRRRHARSTTSASTTSRPGPRAARPDRRQPPAHRLLQRRVRDRARVACAAPAARAASSTCSRGAPRSTARRSSTTGSPEAAVVERRRRHHRPLVRRHHRLHGGRDAARRTCGGVRSPGLIDDMYRALVYPGGVSNYGFPLLWTGRHPARVRRRGGLLPGIAAPGGGATTTRTARSDCALNIARQEPDGRQRSADPGARATPTTSGTGPARSSRTSTRSTCRSTSPAPTRTSRPGPRGQRTCSRGRRRARSGSCSRTATTTPRAPPTTACPRSAADRKAWLDHWVRGVNGGFGTQHAGALVGVGVLRDAQRDGRRPDECWSRTDARTPRRFPLPDTDWTDWYLHGDGSLTTAAPTASESRRSRTCSGTRRQFWSYQAGGDVGPPRHDRRRARRADVPQRCRWRPTPPSPGRSRRLCSCRAPRPDTELFVELIDEAPDGSRTYLQRGVLQASHRAVDDAAERQHARRPHLPTATGRTRTRPAITPGQTDEYLVEVWPVGHVFRAGHRIVGQGARAAVRRQLLRLRAAQRARRQHGAPRTPSTPSRIMLPMVPLTGVQLGAPLPCGAQEAVRCVAQPG